MKNRLISASLLAALALGATAASAQVYDRNGPRDNGPPMARPGGDPRYGAAQNDRRGPEFERHEFRRGGHVPPAYRSRQYVVEDWREHRLSAPPRGHHWVQAGGDYLLVSIRTGAIVQVIGSR
ncbi:RcnB family protein [Sphingomonas sp. NCPPB 2930]